MNAVKLIDLPQNFKRYADRIVQNEPLLVSCPQKGDFVLITKKRYQELDEVNKKSLTKTRLKATIDSLQKSAIVSNAGEMSMEEIIAEISDYRQEKRGL